MCPAAAPSERDTAMAAGGARAGRGYHVALHTPRAFTAPVDYHPTALLIGADSSCGTWFPAERTPGGAEEPGHGHSVCPPDGNGRPGPDQHHLIPGSRSHSTLSEARSEGPAPAGTGAPGAAAAGTGAPGAGLPGIAGPDSDTPQAPAGRPAAGDGPAVMNDAYTWHAPEYVRLSGELCSYRPWGSTGTGLATTDGDVLEAAPSVSGSPLEVSEAALDESDSSITGNPAVVRQFTPEPPPLGTASVRSAGSDRELPALTSAEPPPRHRHRRAKPDFPAVRYAAGGALLLVIAAVLARRWRHH